jgi:hypothetical protein
VIPLAVPIIPAGAPAISNTPAPPIEDITVSQHRQNWPLSPTPAAGRQRHAQRGSNIPGDEPSAGIDGRRRQYPRWGSARPDR